MSYLYHIPVLCKEVVEALCVQTDGVYVDATFGGGGHSRAILAALGEEGRLFAFDTDAAVQAHLIEDKRFHWEHHNFRHIRKILRLHQVYAVDGILADLGVSSHQIDTAERGFSMRYPQSYLDMRMNQSSEQTAQDIIAHYTEEALTRLFTTYADLPNARALAQAIITHRKTYRITRVGQLSNIVARHSVGNPNRYMAQVFQALRIAVNDELGALQCFLEQSKDLLKEGGRLCVITFHSIEDVMVKQYIKHASDALCAAHKKPLLPSREEVRRNKRSASAKLRVAVKKTGTK